jgi:hypothetical protein
VKFVQIFCHQKPWIRFWIRNLKMLDPDPHYINAGTKPCSKGLLTERLGEMLTSTMTEPAGAVEIFMVGGVEAEASGSSSKYSQLKRYQFVAVF